VQRKKPSIGVIAMMARSRESRKPTLYLTTRFVSYIPFRSLALNAGLMNRE
jgi:hypothetical protein